MKPELQHSLKDCRDCKWCEPQGDRSVDRCRHPATTRYAGIARQYGCGKEAKYFEPKPPPVTFRERLRAAWRILRGVDRPEVKQDPPPYQVGQWSE